MVVQRRTFGFVPDGGRSWSHERACLATPVILWRAVVDGAQRELCRMPLNTR